MGTGSIWPRVAAGVAAVLTLATVVAVVVFSPHSSGSTGPATTTTGHGGSGHRGDAQGGAGHPAASRPRRAGGGSGHPAPDPAVRVTVGARTEGTVPAGFLGFSFEFQAVRTYTGTDPAHINPVLVQLIRNLTPGQAPVLRIGGDSTDISYVPARGVHPPAFVDYPLTPGWLATTSALSRALRARLIMGLNLAADQPGLAAAEARAFVRTFGRATIDALEIGNEPNVYSKITVDHIALGVPLAARPRTFGYPAFRAQFDAIAARTPTPTPALAGPALAVGPTPGPGSWVQSMGSFLRRHRRLSMMTVHRYPLRNCYVPPSSAQYPSIPHLLAPYATEGLAASLRRWIAIAHAAGRRLRLDELNSVACRGKAGVSDRFASALWVTDALFSLARAGVDGIDMHTLPDSAYELFQFSEQGGRWSAQVRPVYYGLQLFARAAPAGSRILALHQAGSASTLSSWATRAPDGRLRIVLINKDPQGRRTVTVRLPAGTVAATAEVQRMTAPSVAAGSGVTLGGAGYGSSTGSGRLPAPRQQALAIRGGRMTVAVAPGSAALVTVG